VIRIPFNRAVIVIRYHTLTEKLSIVNVASVMTPTAIATTPPIKARPGMTGEVSLLVKAFNFCASSKSNYIYGIAAPMRSRGNRAPLQFLLPQRFGTEVIVEEEGNSVIVKLGAWACREFLI
jgi:hypothetical protein